MRIVKLVLAAVIGVLALAAGVFGFALIAGSVLVFLLIRWARRRFGRSAATARPRPMAQGGDVIDVVATEKPSHRLDR